MRNNELERRSRAVAGIAWAAALAVVVSVAGCINVQSERGVEARWHSLEDGTFIRGETSRAAVLDALGPPSQVLSLAEGSAFYYMLETTTGEGLILLVYNTRTEATSYDRAVFFFDEEGVLTDYALSEAKS